MIASRVTSNGFGEVFSPDAAQRELAQEIFSSLEGLPLICPHGHLDPRIFSVSDARLGNPADMFVKQDHYVLRMLFSQGVALEQLGVGSAQGTDERDPKDIWQIFSDHFSAFRGTPTYFWIQKTLRDVFEIEEKLTSESAGKIYDHIERKLSSERFAPRVLCKRFNIEGISTTDSSVDSLEEHLRITQETDLVVRPTFRPDELLKLDTVGWPDYVKKLGELTQCRTFAYGGFLEGIRLRRLLFKARGATATDHDAETPNTNQLSKKEAESIFESALTGQIGNVEARAFEGHMLSEMAKMSADDGLVMQLHVGSVRNHNRFLHQKFGPHHGSDIPTSADWTNGLRTLLNLVGNHPNFSLILFTLDESSYSRELAPIAGHYPSVRIGPPWWFFDSMFGIERFLDAVVETAGIQNLAGFNDDSRNFVTIPARHDLWRRTCSNWLAGLVLRGMIDHEDAFEMASDLAYNLAKKAYRL